MAVCLPPTKNVWKRNDWARSNLFRNPFGELTLEQRVELAIFDVQPIVDLMSQSAGTDPVAVQFIGKCGRGKTTRMRVLASCFDDSSYTYLPEDGFCPPIPAGRPVLIDEAQRMPRRVWRKVFASGLPLILATHRDLSGGLRRYGYRVKTEQIGTSNSPELLCQVLNRRIEASRLASGSIPIVSLPFARLLFQQFGTDTRAIENHLYEIVQSQVNHHGEVRFDD